MHAHEICTCRCHGRDDRVTHFAACCYPCPHCNRDISRTAFTRHFNRCASAAAADFPVSPTVEP